MELKRVDLLSVAKITTIFGLIAGIVIAIVLGVGGSFLQGVSEESLQAAGISSSFSWQTAIWAIISYTVAGFVWGFLAALIYNLIAKYAGGIKFEVKK